MAKTGKKRVIQTHHISYEPEVTVKIFKGEHWVITQLERRTQVSKGMIKVLENYIAKHREQAWDLNILVE